jgi:hypothetical protein
MGMNVVESADNLAKDEGNQATSKWATFAGFDEMIQITLHGLEYKIEFLGGRQKKEIV